MNHPKNREGQNEEKENTMLIDAPTAPPTLLPMTPAKGAPKRRRWWQRKATDAEVRQ